MLNLISHNSQATFPFSPPPPSTTASDDVSESKGSIGHMRIPGIIGEISFNHVAGSVWPPRPPHPLLLIIMIKIDI